MQAKKTYILTDGIEIFKTKEMTIDELDDANAQCDVATCMNVWWELKKQ